MDNDVIIINGRKAKLGPEIPFEPNNDKHYDKNEYYILKEISLYYKTYHESNCPRLEDIV